MQHAHGRMLKIPVVVATLLIVIGAGLFLYQLRRAETGRSNYLPRPVREFFAAREYRAAKNAEYEDRRLRGYLKVLSLDGDHYPDVWEHICSINVKSRVWDAAKVSCQRVVDFEGPTVSNQTTLGKVYENLKDYSISAEAYAKAAHMNPRDPVIQEKALWMLLASGNYAQAVASASNLVAHDSGGSTPMDTPKAHVVLGFAYGQLGDREKARAEYAVALPDVREPACSLENDHNGGLAIVCSGVSRKNGSRVSSCIGAGCQ